MPSPWAKFSPSRRLVKTLDAALPGFPIAVSTTTRTGQALARERFGLESRFLLPARSALGRERVPERHEAEPADPGRNRILAQPADWMFPSRNSCCRGQRAHLRSLVAAIPAARGLWRPLLSRLKPRAGAKRRPTPNGCVRSVASPSGSSVAGNLKFDVRAAQESEATRLLKIAGRGSAIRRCRQHA